MLKKNIKLSKESFICAKELKIHILSILLYSSHIKKCIFALFKKILNEYKFKL